MFDLQGNSVQGYNLQGTLISPCYDIIGNALTSGAGSIHEQLTIQKFQYYDAWKVNCDSAYALMKAEYDNTPNSIPLYISTDQHGSGLSPSRYVHNIDTTELANICLGDTVPVVFDYVALDKIQSNMTPVANHIMVVGNHDADSSTNYSQDIANNEDLKRYYTTSMEKVMSEDAEVAYYKALDRERNVKYLVLCPYYMNADGKRNGVEIKTNQMQWLIDELTANDGFDSVILIHQYLTNSCLSRDGVFMGTLGGGTATTLLQNVWVMLKDRRNGRSGTIADSDGVSHSYDFTNCQTRLLCCLQGHRHEELYQTEENMTQYVADWQGNYHGGTFGLIDRDNSKLKVWVFNSNSKQDVFEMNI